LKFGEKRPIGWRVKSVGIKKFLKAFGLAEFAGEGGVGMGKAKPYHG